MSECLDLQLGLQTESNLVLLKIMIWVLYLFTMKYLEIPSLMVYLIESRETVTAHGNLDGLLVGISLVQEYGTTLESSVILLKLN